MEEDWKKRIQQYKTIWKAEAKQISIMKKVLEEKDDVGSVVTCFVIAPLLCAYVSWVVREAEKTGKKRLYFLARDGYYMKKVAEIFCKEWKLPIECRYLYGSRYIWRGAVYHQNTEEALDYITLGGLEVNFNKVMQRAGLKEEVQTIANRLGYDKESKQRFSAEERKILRKKLSECELFLQLLNKYSKEKYEKTVEYLVQEGLTDNIHYALVDSGWTGSLQKSLTKILKNMGYEKVLEGYYFGMYHRPIQKEVGLYHTYYFSPEKNIKRKVFFNNNVFECVYSAPHGMTIGYEQKEMGKWLPVLEQKENPNKERLEKVEPLLLAYAKEYANSYKKNWKCEQKIEKECLEKVVYLFMSRPTKEEVEEYGTYVFCDDVIGEEKQVLAPNLSKQQLKQGFLLAKLKKRWWKSKRMEKGSAWLEGSVCLVMGERGFWHCVLCEYIRFLVETFKNKRQDRKKNE